MFDKPTFFAAVTSKHVTSHGICCTIYALFIVVYIKKEGKCRVHFPSLVSYSNVDNRLSRYLHKLFSYGITPWFVGIP